MTRAQTLDIIRNHLCHSWHVGLNADAQAGEAHACRKNDVNVQESCRVVMNHINILKILSFVDEYTDYLYECIRNLYGYRRQSRRAV